MKNENFIVKAGLFYVLSVFLGMYLSWEYCGCELMFIAFYYLMRAVWYEITHD